jgi:signal transduction histidine kinase
VINSVIATGNAVTLAFSLLAFGVSLGLSGWCLGRVARTLPTVLLALITVCIAVWNGFEYLWLRHGVKTYQHLGFVGGTLAPCLLFHYAIALSPELRFRRTALTLMYSGTAFLVLTNLGGFVSPELEEFFWTPGYNVAFLAFFVPAALATLVLLERGRRKAPEAAVKSLFTYPLAAGLVAIPLGFLELAIPMGLRVPRTASLGGLAASVILAVGIYRHRRVYDALALLRLDAANVLRATVQGVVYVDGGGRVLFSNSVAKEFLGLEPRTLAESGLEVPERERTLVQRGGRILEVRAVRSGDALSSGRISLVLQDKTRDLELLRTLASKEALASLGEAAATLAHEIRNPLTAVKSALDCIAQDVAEGRPPESRHSRTAQSEIRRLNELLERSLELGRPLELRREPCDVNVLVRSAVGRAAPAGAVVATELAEGISRVSGDPDLLVQLLANLVRNAVEASQDVRVTTGRQDGGVVVRVLSAGARIPPEILPRLFEPFVTSKARGTGLGLALSRKIVAAHDGRIEGRNTETGVEFEVRLPA